MVKRKDIRAFVSQVVEQFHPRRVILFGSYAYGRPTPDSDVDLLVVMRHEGHPALQAAEIRRRIRARFPMDLLVRSPQEVRRRLSRGDVFISEIMERGERLYEAGHG
jgi:predicted nucleotidyltransferase